ncbi:MAG TPA: hypothetical protein DD381_10465 [Lentisphaeria bacterium]|nr:MAG: hypothetical protein A2X47_02205 [Lentisphaerae bacterium GWF2_38_69]HBM16749.1 hypothetical protein [Lentisphaeria bacterium]
MIENKLRPTKEEINLTGFNFEDYDAPLFIAWQLNSICNLECLHCCEEAGHTMENELNKEEVKDFCNQIAALNIPYVAISGGEPMLHPDFFEICEFFRKNNISLKVETNGHFIGPEEARRFAELGFRSVQISVDGRTPQTFETMRVNGDYEKTLNACRLLVDAGVNTEIVFVPTKFNIHETGDMIEMAYEMGIYGFYTGKIMRIGRAAQNWDKLNPSQAEYEAFFKVLQEKQLKYEGKMKIYYYPYDVIEELRYRLHHPAASLLVIPNGNVKLIGPLPFVCGNLRENSLAELWEKYKKAWRKPEVVEFTNRVIENPELLKEANTWKQV